MDKKKINDEEHVITDREKRAWKEKKKRGAKERPTLNRSQRIEFLELVAKLSSRSTFERKLGLSPSDVEHFKQEFNIESQDEARKAARRLRRDISEEREARILEETNKARDAEAVANQRLEELQAKRAQETLEASEGGVDINEIRKEDADRQRRFAEQQAELAVPKTEWRLPLESHAGSREEQIDRFRREIIYHGFTFLRRKYQATETQVKYEANRLGLKINWEIVRK